MVSSVRKPVQVLFIDDHPDFLEIVKIFLERNGEFSIDITTSGKTALELLRSGSYDVILSDFCMARMDGDEFLIQARMIDPGIPFIYFTGKEKEEVIIPPLSEGSVSYLQKGGDPAVRYAELEQQIRTVISQRDIVSLTPAPASPPDNDWGQYH